MPNNFVTTLWSHFWESIFDPRFGDVKVIAELGQVSLHITAMARKTLMGDLFWKDLSYY